MTFSLGVVVEQMWHRLPGGTGRATTETVGLLGASETQMRITGMAAWHRRQYRRDISGVHQIRYAKLPRPLLYEAWLRSNKRRNSNQKGTEPGFDAVWAAAGISPPVASPIVATIHDLDFLDYPEFVSRRGRSFFPRMWATTRDRADIIVCPSQTVADRCESQGVERQRLRVVPWGVHMGQADKGSSDQDHKDLVDRLGLPQKFALWVGTVEPRKNLTRLVRALEQVPNLGLVVVGPSGWNQDHGNMPDQSSTNVRFVGQVDDDTLLDLYRAASVFVFPSIAEGFGLPVLEAMAAGTPVVTSLNTATAEVAGDAALLVDPHDETAIAEAVSTVVNDPIRAEELKQRGLDRAELFSWDQTAKLYSDIFYEAAGR